MLDIGHCVFYTGRAEEARALISDAQNVPRESSSTEKVAVMNSINTWNKITPHQAPTEIFETLAKTMD
jgi:hypothetical protein